MAAEVRVILILVTYLAGILTILSPCILPVLPFVFSTAQTSFLRSGVPLLVGMAATFAGVSTLAIISGEWIARANEAGRWIAMGLMLLFGLSLIFPRLSERLFEPLTRIGSRVGGGPSRKGILRSFLIGVSTGLLWAPCAGPILGLVLTGAATRGNAGSSAALLLAYALGSATSLGLALVAGNRFLGTMKRFLGVDRYVKKFVGVAVLTGVAIIALNLDRTLLTKISKVETASLETKLLALAQGDKPAAADAESIQSLPEFTGVQEWLNSPPLMVEGLRGKVVLIDFWTYSCINCLRTLPFVRGWAQTYADRGLVVVGVHTPEFPFERSVANVRGAVADLKVTYPVAIDNDYRVWNAFHNQAWPSHYFFDRTGKLRRRHAGEGQYAESEAMIRELLAEDGRPIGVAATVSSQPVPGGGVEAAPSETTERSPETYLGFERTKNFAGSPKIVTDEVTAYRAPADLPVDHWALTGTWLVAGERVQAKRPRARLSYRFRGRDLHLVMSGAGRIKFRVTVDGRVPGAAAGTDLDKDGRGVIDGNRLYQLVRLANDSTGADHQFEIEFEEAGAEAYAFTFG